MIGKLSFKVSVLVSISLRSFLLSREALLVLTIFLFKSFLLVSRAAASKKFSITNNVEASTRLLDKFQK